MKFWTPMLLLLTACAGKQPAPTPVETPTPTNPEPVDPERWVGNYEAHEACGKTAGGSGVNAKHVLRVLFERGVLVAYLNADGFQTMTRLKGTVHLSPGRIIVTLDEFLGGFNGVVLQRGDALVMLTDTDEGLEVIWGVNYLATCG